MSQLYTTITSSLFSHQVMVLLKYSEPEGDSRLCESGPDSDTKSVSEQPN